MNKKTKKALFEKNKLTKILQVGCFISVAIASIVPFVLNEDFKAIEVEKFITYVLKDTESKEPKCESYSESGVLCKSENITIDNQNKAVVSESETILLMEWFENNVWFGPEVVDLDRIIISNTDCVIEQELGCGGLTNFYDSKKTTIELYPKRIVSSDQNFDAPLIRTLTFRDLAYYLAHEYYHHVTQISLFDLVPESGIADGAGNSLDDGNYAFSVERNKRIVDEFIAANSLNAQESDLDGVSTPTCPLESRSRSSIFAKANSAIKDQCSFFMKFPSFSSDASKSNYPLIANTFPPSSLPNCGYLSNTVLDWTALQYFFNIDEIIIRQLLLMTYVDPASKIQSEGKINCHNVISKKNSSIGPINTLLYDYYLLSNMKVLPFNKVSGFDYETATATEKNTADSVKSDVLSLYKKNFYRTNEELGYFFYNTENKRFSVGGYLDYDNVNNNFLVQSEGESFVVKSLVFEDEDGNKENINIHPKGKIRTLSTFNGINPETRLVDSSFQNTDNSRQGYITDEFRPQEKEYKLSYLVTVDGEEKLIPVEDVANDIVRVNRGTISAKRNYLVQKKEDGVYAIFK